MSNSPEEKNPSDVCLQSCLKEVRLDTEEQLIQKIATLKGVSTDEVADKLRGYTKEGFRIEYCHLRCVSGYGSMDASQKLPGKTSIDLKPSVFK